MQSMQNNRHEMSKENDNDCPCLCTEDGKTETECHIVNMYKNVSAGLFIASISNCSIIIKVAVECVILLRD